MKCKTNKLLLLAFFLLCFQAESQPYQNEIISGYNLENVSDPIQNKINFFVISKRKKGRFDIATKYNILRTKFKTIFHGKNFVAIVARDGNDMTKKIEQKLNKRNAKIGTIWFDSHGNYRKGYSLFTIGNDQYSNDSFKDSSLAAHFKKLAYYISPESKIIIGSCYGGATFTRLTNGYKDTVQMHGDSLMIAVGKLLQNGVVYGSESWVMSRPGLFLKKMSVYGHPGRNKFHDSYFKPAWESIGKWNKYVVASSQFMPANAITLNSSGKLFEFQKPYFLKKKYKKRITRIIGKLRPGILKNNNI